VTVRSQNLNFQRHRSWFFAAFNYLNGDVIIRFVDIGAIADHHCLDFLFRIINENINKNKNVDIKFSAHDAFLE